MVIKFNQHNYSVRPKKWGISKILTFDVYAFLKVEINFYFNLNYTCFRSRKFTSFFKSNLKRNYMGALDHTIEVKAPMRQCKIFLKYTIWNVNHGSTFWKTFAACTQLLTLKRISLFQQTKFYKIFFVPFISFPVLTITISFFQWTEISKIFWTLWHVSCEMSSIRCHRLYIIFQMSRPKYHLSNVSYHLSHMTC